MTGHRTNHLGWSRRASQVGRALALVLLSGVILTQPGCIGGGGLPYSLEDLMLLLKGCWRVLEAPSTHAQVSIYWPLQSRAASRAIMAPSSALSAVVTLKNANPCGGDFAFTVNRPKDPNGVLVDYTSEQPVLTGSFALRVEFYSAFDGAGDAVGEACDKVTIATDGTGIGTVAAEGKVASVVIPPDQVVKVGQTADLAATVRSRTGELLALGKGAFFWMVTEGESYLSFDTWSGSARGLKRGTANVQATVDGIASAPTRVLIRREMRAFLLPKLMDGGQMYPAAISEDGTTVVGTATDANGIPEAFRWTEADGIAGLGFVPGYEDGSRASATSRDGSVVVGMSINQAMGAAAPWVWTNATGLQGIELPDAALGGNAVDVSEDGNVVLGTYTYLDPDPNIGLCVQTFVWTRDGGLVNVDGSAVLKSLSQEAAGLSGDGYVIIENRELFVHDPDPNQDASEGALRYEYSGTMASGYWAGMALSPANGPSLYAYDGAVSRNGNVVAGYVHIHGNWVSPAIWTAATGLFHILPEVIGYAKTVSADGSMVGGGNDDPGTAFLWDAAGGAESLVVHLQRYDDEHGTSFLDVFADSGLPSNVTGISEDNARIVGTAGAAIFDYPCYGFVLELP